MVGFGKSRRATQYAANNAKKILKVLALTGDPKNVSQLAKTVGTNGGLLIVSLKFLYDQGWIASKSGKWSRITAAADADSYFITTEGRRQLELASSK